MKKCQILLFFLGLIASNSVFAWDWSKKNPNIPGGLYEDQCEGCKYEGGWLTCDNCVKDSPRGSLVWRHQTSLHAGWCDDRYDIHACDGVLYCGGCP